MKTERNRPPLALLAWRQTWRDFRAGELRLLAFAVVLAVAALSAVSFFADRLQAGLSRDAGQLLGGDLAVSGDQPLPAAWAQAATEHGLRIARTVSFPSMARAPQEQGGQFRLVAVKAVAGGYPLRGQLKVRDALGREAALAQGPQAGSVWVDAALLDGLNLALGDHLLLGEARLLIERAILNEPDRGSGFMSFSPRVMLHEQDLQATGLIQPASRVTYRLMVMAPDSMGRRAAELALSSLRQTFEAQITRDSLRGVRLDSLEAGRPEMRQALDRAERFLTLVALLSALLAAVAVGIAARDFTDRHLDDCALLRVLGLHQREIAALYALEFALVGVVACAMGVALGWLVHHGFVALLAGLVKTSLPGASLQPGFLAAALGWVLLMGFGLPPVLQLAQVPPLRVIRRDVGRPRPFSVGVLAAGALSFTALLLAVSSDLRLGLITVGGFALALLLFAGLAALAMVALRRLVPRLPSAPRWQALVMATRQLAARPGFSVLQVSALSVGLLSLILLVLLRTDLVASWRSGTPPDAPNRFVINIQPEQSAGFEQQLKDAGVQGYDWYPMIRGRLVGINGQAIQPGFFSSDRAQRLVEREFNLSHTAQLPGHNQVSAGRWTPDEANGLSVEEGLAQTLQLQLGDRLQFDIAGTMREGRITSLRKVEWGSMRVNFFVLFPQAEIGGLPSTYTSAFKAPAAADIAQALDRELLQSFPNITNVDISASVAQVQQVLNQVISAVEFLFTFTLASGLLVLVATITATREARVREYAVMRALGARSGLLQRMQRAELLGVGALSGLLAACVAIAVGAVLARSVFEFNWAPSPWVPAAGLLAGALLAWWAGAWGLRAIWRRPVVDTLRRAAS
jgi:putative ABC transport system permease protein